jgi:hypothetical protein
LLLEDIGPGYPDIGMYDLLGFNIVSVPSAVHDIVLEGKRGGKRIDAASTNKRVVDVSLPTGEAITLRRLTISGGKSGDGAGIRVTGGTLNLENGVVITNNENDDSNGNGGGVYVTGSSTTLNMLGGEISGNKVTDTNYGKGGGVLVSDSGKFTMTGGSIRHNDSGNDGGGLMVIFDGTAEIENGSIEYNRAQFGGGIYLRDGTVTLGMAGGTHPYPYIQDNTTTGTGGGITINGTPPGTMTFHHGTICNNKTSLNSATGWGGGIQIVHGTLDMRGGTVAGNQGGRGPGIAVENYSDAIFTMSAYARVREPGNPVYLDNAPTTKITIPTDFSGDYAAGIAVIDVNGKTSGTPVVTGTHIGFFYRYFTTTTPGLYVSATGHLTNSPPQPP